MINPVQGSTLSGSSVTFQWADAHAPEYWLEIGTTLGGTNLHNASHGTNLSATISGLPTNGSTIYVRLWTRIGSGWCPSCTNYNDYTYTAATPVKAVMTSPVSGSTLTGSSVTFQWTNVGATQYWLSIGTTGAGADNIYDGSQGTNTSATISGLPLNGSTVYVRLWTYQGGGSWLSNDYTYTAMTPAKAVMTSPAPGSTLSGSSVAFEWTNVSAQEYALYIGTAAGANNLYGAESLGTSTSVNVSGLPTNGSTLYVRLYTRQAGLWYFNDYTYTAASPPGFTSQLNNSGAGWAANSGTWSLQSNKMSTTQVVAGQWASVSYSTSFTALDFQANLKRTGCLSCANSLLVRGAPAPSDGNLKDWNHAYAFEFSAQGQYSVWEKSGAEWIALQAWTDTAAINQGDAWNMLRVVAMGSNLNFYINGTLVWSGSDLSLSSGLVGVEMYSDGTAQDQLRVEGANALNSFEINSVDTVSAAQQALNVAANQDLSRAVDRKMAPALVASPTATSANATTTPTLIPTPTETPESTATPAPTETPTPEDTPTPSPTNTPAPAETETPT